MNDLNPLFELSRQMVSRLTRSYHRNLAGPPIGRVRGCIVTGQRGVGKTTWMVQYLLSRHPNVAVTRRCLYLPADHFLVARFPLYEVAEAFAQDGGELLCVDEIHRAANWSRDLKSALDTFPELEIVATGSSLLHLQRGTHDLSRRVVVRRMEGLSFREYLELRYGLNLSAYSLPDVLAGHERIAAEITGGLEKRKIAVLGAFHQYLSHGYYPFSSEFDNPTDFFLALQQSSRAALESDLPALHPTLSGATIQRVQRLLAAVAAQVPFTPDLTKLRRLLDIADDRTLKEYLRYLEDAGLTQVLRRAGGGLRSMDKPDRIYLGDPNLAHALAAPEAPDTGTVRETFFVRAVGAGHDVRAGDRTDFVVNSRYHIEVGGRSKGPSQMAGKREMFLALDGLKAGAGPRIPLWLFGFLER